MLSTDTSLIEFRSREVQGKVQGNRNASSVQIAKLLTDPRSEPDDQLIRNEELKIGVGHPIRSIFKKLSPIDLS